MLRSFARHGIERVEILVIGHTVRCLWFTLQCCSARTAFCCHLLFQSEMALYIAGYRWNEVCCLNKVLCHAPGAGLPPRHIAACMPHWRERCFNLVTINVASDSLWSGVKLYISDAHFTMNWRYNIRHGCTLQWLNSKFGVIPSQQNFIKSQKGNAMWAVHRAGYQLGEQRDTESHASLHSSGT